MSRRLVFIGVTTGSSSIMRIFPRWRDALGLPGDVEISGCDLPVGAPPEAFREAVAALKDDPDVLGALVTTHKLDVLRAAEDLFDELDEHARALGEVSCIARRDGRLLGWAKDTVTAARALEHLTPPGFFADGGHVLCLGAGGAGGAIVAHVRTLGPARIVITDRNPERLARFEGVDTVLTEDATELLQALPPRSLVINATGMGKDRPGSPVRDDARFPERSVVWELNYRGELGFLRQAREQERERELVVADGWGYFVRGWAAVIEEVFERPIGDEDLELLSREAAAVRDEGKG
jgi:shikimate 5-dehydrogenase